MRTIWFSITTLALVQAKSVTHFFSTASYSKQAWPYHLRLCVRLGMTILACYPSESMNNTVARTRTTHQKPHTLRTHTPVSLSLGLAGLVSPRFLEPEMRRWCIVYPKIAHDVHRPQVDSVHQRALVGSWRRAHFSRRQWCKGGARRLIWYRHYPILIHSVDNGHPRPAQYSGTLRGEWFIKLHTARLVWQTTRFVFTRRLFGF